MDRSGLKGRKEKTERTLVSIQKEALRIAIGTFYKIALQVIEAETLTTLI
jgi:hypothetical protein